MMYAVESWPREDYCLRETAVGVAGAGPGPGNCRSAFQLAAFESKADGSIGSIDRQDGRIGIHKSSRKNGGQNKIGWRAMTLPRLRFAATETFAARLRCRAQSVPLVPGMA